MRNLHRLNVQPFHAGSPISLFLLLAHIERPQEKPFYHVYPDLNDCISAFDGPRSFRYVCQDNLELSLNNNKHLDFEMTLDPDEWKWVGDSGSYIPSIGMRVSCVAT